MPKVKTNFKIFQFFVGDEVVQLNGVEMGKNCELNDLLPCPNAPNFPEKPPKKDKKKKDKKKNKKNKKCK